MSLTDTQFHQYADEIFQQIETAIEQAIDEQDADIDIDATGGVLQITFEDSSKIVINKQEPLHQIWLATKFGGYHFVYEQGQWMDSRSGMGEFLAFVQQSITKQSGLSITL